MHELTRGLPVVNYRFMAWLIPLTVLIGGFMLRYVVVIAGQITYPIGL